MSAGSLAGPRGGFRYYGKLCAKHPHLNGERFSSSKCVACDVERQRNARRILFQKLGRHHLGKICPRHPELEGKRWPRGACVGCVNDHQDKRRDKKLAQQKLPEARAKRQARCRKLYRTEPHFKLSLRLRNRLNEVLRRQDTKKNKSVFALIGCTPEFLIQHLERQFKPGMTWANWSIDGWHIDHIKPCASFNFKDPAQQRKCFHYTNLQPLWALDNLSKGARVQS